VRTGRRQDTISTISLLVSCSTEDHDCLSLGSDRLFQSSSLLQCDAKIVKRLNFLFSVASFPEDLE
jgi:hypothetical protein